MEERRTSPARTLILNVAPERTSVGARGDMGILMGLPSVKRSEIMGRRRGLSPIRILNFHDGIAVVKGLKCLVPSRTGRGSQSGDRLPFTIPSSIREIESGEGGQDLIEVANLVQGSKRREL